MSPSQPSIGAGRNFATYGSFRCGIGLCTPTVLKPQPRMRATLSSIHRAAPRLFGSPFPSGPSRSAPYRFSKIARLRSDDTSTGSMWFIPSDTKSPPSGARNHQTPPRFSSP